MSQHYIGHDWLLGSVGEHVQRFQLDFRATEGTQRRTNADRVRRFFSVGISCQLETLGGVVACRFGVVKLCGDAGASERLKGEFI